MTEWWECPTSYVSLAQEVAAIATILYELATTVLRVISTSMRHFSVQSGSLFAYIKPLSKDLARDATNRQRSPPLLRYAKKTDV
jgi:hypothetical protein